VDDDVRRLTFLNKTIGDVPLSSFQPADAERALAALPATTRTSATRRHYAQLISKILKLAVYPCKIIERSSLPVGFLPKVTSGKATAWLYPDEDSKLLASSVPIERRVLYGFLAREGCRLSEALSLRWLDHDLERGVIPEPRWCSSCLKRRRPISSGAIWRTLTWSAPSCSSAPRRGCRSASTISAPCSSTLSLANNRTEAWVADRTGHKSSAMINRYRRAARHAAELGLGEARDSH
jgi:integrase